MNTYYPTSEYDDAQELEALEDWMNNLMAEEAFLDAMYEQDSLFESCPAEEGTN